MYIKIDTNKNKSKMQCIVILIIVRDFKIVVYHGIRYYAHNDYVSTLDMFNCPWQRVFRI